MQDNDMREKLEKIISAYEELQAKMSDPAVLADQKTYNHLAKEYANQGPLAAKAREYLACCSDIDDAKEMLADSDMKEFAQETIAEAESKTACPRRGHQVHAHSLGPCRREGHHRGDPRCCRRRRGGDLRGRPVQDVRALLLFPASWKIELMDVSPSEAGGVQGNPVQGEGRQGVLRHEVRVRRAPRAARAQDGKPGPHPHVHGDCCRASRGRRG